MNHRLRGLPYEFTVKARNGVKIPVGFRPAIRHAFIHDWNNDVPPYWWVREHGAGKYYIILDVPITKSDDAVSWTELFKEGKGSIGEIIFEGWMWPDKGNEE